ncbi:hypothetical protein GCM10010519_58450 [Streptomyces lactacystinicus]
MAADSTVTVVSLMGVLLSWMSGAGRAVRAAASLVNIPYPPRVMKRVRRGASRPAGAVLSGAARASTRRCDSPVAGARARWGSCPASPDDRHHHQR